MVNATRAIAVLCAGLVPCAAEEAIPGWFSLPVPGVERAERADAGLAGRAEPGGPLVDGLANGSRSWTAMSLRYQSDRGQSDAGNWSRELSAFDLQAVLGGEGGLTFGVQAQDLQPGPALRSGDVSWGLEDPVGGLRVGLGADALRPLGKDKNWTLALAAWIPVFSSALDWELQAALVRRRKFRLDVSWEWGEPSAPGKAQLDRGDSSWSDTLRWRTRRQSWAARLGGSPVAGLAVQGWMGRRLLRDPGEGEAGWRIGGRSWFGGAQATVQRGGASMDAEVRGDEGSETARFDTAEAPSWSVPSRLRGNADHSVWDGRLEIRATPWAVSERIRVQPAAGAQASWVRVEGAGPDSVAVPWAGGGSWGELHRWEIHAGAVAAFPWLSAEGTLGVQRHRMEGDPPRLWWGWAVPGERWTLPWALRLFHNGEGGTTLSYRISGEIRVAGDRDLRAGLRHDFRVGQEF